MINVVFILCIIFIFSFLLSIYINSNWWEKYKREKLIKNKIIKMWHKKSNKIIDFSRKELDDVVRDIIYIYLMYSDLNYFFEDCYNYENINEEEFFYLKNILSCYSCKYFGKYKTFEKLKKDMLLKELIL